MRLTTDGVIRDSGEPDERVFGAREEAYLPGVGWVDFDPTNSIVGNRNLIRVAVAWAPEHVLPLWGTYVGRARAFLSMDVTVTVAAAVG